MTIISVIVETVASGTMLGGPTTLTPFLIGQEESRATYGVTLLVISIILHIVALVMIFLRRKYFLEKPKDIKPLKTLILKEENPVNRLENIRIGIGGIPVVLILAAGVFGMMNEYFGWLSFLLHAAYLIGIGVMTVVIGGIFRFAQKNETNKKRGAIFRELCHGWRTILSFHHRRHVDRNSLFGDPSAFVGTGL